MAKPTEQTESRYPQYPGILLSNELAVGSPTYLGAADLRVVEVVPRVRSDASVVCSERASGCESETSANRAEVPSRRNAPAQLTPRPLSLVAREALPRGQDR